VDGTRAAHTSGDGGWPGQPSGRSGCPSRYPQSPSRQGHPRRTSPRQKAIRHRAGATQPLFPTSSSGVVFQDSPTIILRALNASRPGSLRSSPQHKKDPRRTDHTPPSRPFFFCSEPGHPHPPDWDQGRENHTNRMTPEVGTPGRARRACVPGWPRPFKGPAQGLSSPPGELRQ
jgi:hypothetical protein